MRIWCLVPAENLCGPHLLAQWRECLGLARILARIHAGESCGYAGHPETLRWVGRERPLWNLLHRTRSAMLARNWRPMPVPDAPQWVLAQPSDPWRDSLPPPWDDQLAALRAKRCACKVPAPAPIPAAPIAKPMELSR